MPPGTEQPTLEQDACVCPACGQSVSFKWQNGFVPEKHNVLVASSVYHAECWDLIEQDVKIKSQSD